VCDVTHKHDPRHQLVMREYRQGIAQVHIVGHLFVPFGDTFHILAPKIDTGKGDKDKSECYFPGFYGPSVQVFIRAYFSPVLVNQDTQTVESAPDNKLPRSPVPQATNEHSKHEVDVGVDVLSHRSTVQGSYIDR